jgi:PilZ domain
MPIEQRAQLRQSTHTPIHVEGDDNLLITGTTDNISLGGLCFNTENLKIGINEIYRFSFEVPVRGKLLPIHAKGKVIQTNFLATETYQVHISFTELDRVSLWTLDAFTSAPASSFTHSTKNKLGLS